MRPLDDAANEGECSMSENKKNGSDPKIQDREIAELLIELGGNLSAVAAELSRKYKEHIWRSYVRKRVDSSSRLMNLMDELRQQLLDRAEEVIRNRVMGGSVEECKFVLGSSLAADRGYGRTLQVEDGDALAIIARMHLARNRKKAEAAAERGLPDPKLIEGSAQEIDDPEPSANGSDSLH
jgi:hypothetical protein